jgi:hypothetical protein
MAVFRIGPTPISLANGCSFLKETARGDCPLRRAIELAGKETVLASSFLLSLRFGRFRGSTADGYSESLSLPISLKTDIPKEEDQFRLRLLCKAMIFGNIVENALEKYHAYQKGN